MKKNRKGNKKAFTLVELLVVIVILALLCIITSVTIFNILNKVYGNIEIQNARVLLKSVNEFILSEKIINSDKNLQGIYIIDDNKGYVLKANGERERFEQFDNNQCEYCVVKINNENKINLLMEGKKQDIKKDYDSDEIYVEKLEVSREDASLYNELNLFVDWYVLNNDINSKERFIANNDSIYKLLDNGDRTEIISLKNSISSNESKLEIDSDLNYLITILNDKNELMTNDNKGNLIEKNDINGEYSIEILNLFEELKYVAENYIKNNTISKELYIEYKDGNMYIIDEYGNQKNNIIMNKNIMGSGELRINTQNQFSVVIYQDTFDIKNNYGTLKLYNEDLKYSRDMVLLIKNLERLELLAQKYAGTSTSSVYTNFYKKTWLVPFYIRRLKYNSSQYNIITGNDASFVTYVSNNASYLKNYFTNTNSFTVNGDTIDLKHMMASLAGNIYNTDWKYNLVYEELEYNCLVSWAGDLHEFMQYNILKNDVKTNYGSFGTATYQLLGNSNTRFSLDDIYADVDNWNIFNNLKKNKNVTIAELFSQYYSGESSRNYKNRFTSFITIMNSVGSSLGKTNFNGLVNYFTNMDKSWDTIGTLTVTPSETEEKEIATNFINWIKERANLEK